MSGSMETAAAPPAAPPGPAPATSAVTAPAPAPAIATSPAAPAAPARGAGRRSIRRTIAVLAAGLLCAVAAGTGTANATQNVLNITMQAQTQSNWCWAGSGNTIATWYGYTYSQNQFCDMAFNRAFNSPCPNSQAALDDVQNAFHAIGIDPGSYVNGYLYYSTVQNEINNNRPVETRIQWSSGGGHMEVIYGYDTADNWVYWGDPWPSDYRYNWADYGYYVSNGSFSWTHSLYRIGA